MKKIILVLMIMTGVLNAMPEKTLKIFVNICEVKKNGNMCYKLGERYKNDKDRSNFYKYMGKACDLGKGEACYSLAETTSGKLAQGDYKRACDYKYKKGCFKYAQITYFGKKVKADKEKGISGFEQGCSLDDEDSCGILGLIYFEKGNKEKAEELLNKSCVLGHEDICNKLMTGYKNGELKKGKLFNSTGEAICKAGFEKTCKIYKEIK